MKILHTKGGKCKISGFLLISCASSCLYAGMKVYLKSLNPLFICNPQGHVLKLPELCFFCLTFVFSFCSFSAESSADTPRSPVINTENIERAMYIERMESIKNYRPQSKEEALYYLQLYDFLSKNKTAQDLLFLAWDGDSSRYWYLRDVINQRSKPIRYLKSIGHLLNNNVDIKGRVDIGKEIAGMGMGIELEVDLDGIVKDVAGGVAKHWTYEEDERGNLKLEEIAQFWTKEQYACLKNQSTCKINTLPILRNALVTVHTSFDNVPQMQDRDGKKLSFEAMATRDPKLAELAQGLFTLRQVEKGTKELSQEEKKTRDTIIETINQIYQEQEAERQKKFGKAKEEAISSALSAPVEQQDPLILSALRHIQDKQDQKALLKLYLEEDGVSQEEKAKYEEKIQKIDQNIQKTKKSIWSYEFKKDIQKAKAWTGAVFSLAQVMGAPQEISQIGGVIDQGFKIGEAVGAMIIAGSLDPTGITLVVTSAAAVVSIVSGIPSTDEVIIQNLNTLRKGQAEIISQLKGLDFKVNILDEKLNDLIRISRMNHEEMIGELKTVQSQLSRMEEDIIIAIEESKQSTLEESQKNLAQFLLDGQVAVRPDSVVKKLHLNEKLSVCQYHKQEDERTQNVRRYQDYNRCIGLAEVRFRNIMKDLDELYGKSVAIFNSSSFVQTAPLHEMNRSKIETKFNLHINDRAGFLSPIFSWLNSQKESDIQEIPVFHKPWTHNSKAWWDYGSLLGNIPADLGPLHSSDSSSSLDPSSGLDMLNPASKLYHPGAYDLAFLTYVQNTTRLPDLDNLAFLYAETTNISVESYQTEQLEDMCQNVKNIEAIANLSRKNLPKAYAVYLYFLSLLNFEIQEPFSSLIKKEVDSYDDYDKAQKDIKFEPKSIEECKAESAYQDQQTNIFKYIANENWTTTQFLSTNPEDIVSRVSWRNHISGEHLKSQGFSYVHPSETACEFHNGRPINKGRVKSPTQVQDLTDTLEKVQNGEQGGCWFYDVYGLISGVMGQRIQLYQKTNINPVTGEDYGYGPTFKPMCAVFVTAGQGKYALFWKWSEPSERAICLSANLEFIYDTYNTSFFNSRNFRGRLYYLDEDSIQEGQSPKMVSAIKYKNRLWNITKHLLTEEEWDRIQNRLDFARYKGESVSIIHQSNTNWYNVSVKELVDKHNLTDKWYGYVSMRIDNIHNANNMGDDAWINNMYRNRDSIGTCNKYACLKPRPKIMADWNGWTNKAEEQIKTAQTELETQLTNLMGPGSFLFLQGQMKKANNKKIPGDLSYPGLVRALFALDTIARVGYGHNLEGQPELAELLQTVLTLKDSLVDDTLTLQEKAEAVQKAFYEHITKPQQENKDVFSLPVVGVAPNSVVGWGRPDLRHEALNIISRRDYLTPPACHYLKEDLDQGYEKVDSRKGVPHPTEEDIKQEERPVPSTEEDIKQEERPVPSTEEDIKQEERPVPSTEEDIKQEERPVLTKSGDQTRLS